MATAKSKTNQVDSEEVVRLFVESVRQKRKKQTPGVKRTRSGIVSKLCHEVGITRAMALFMLKDMHQYKIKDIEPRYLRDTKKKKPQTRSGPKI